MVFVSEATKHLHGVVIITFIYSLFISAVVIASLPAPVMGEKICARLVCAIYYGYDGTTAT